MELGVEKENETAILKHACDLKERLKELNAEIKLLEEQQRKVSCLALCAHPLFVFIVERTAG